MKHSGSPPVGMDLRQVVTGIHERVVRAGNRGAHPEMFLPLRNDLAKLRAGYEQLHDLRRVVGRMPPQPATLRARAGAPLVRFVRRILFWYTPQVQQVNEAAAAFAGHVVTALERQLDLIQQISERIDALESALSSSSSAAQPAILSPDQNQR